MTNTPNHDLGVLFGGADLDPTAPAETQAPAEIPGGRAAPELCQMASRWSVDLHPDDAIGQLKADGRRALYIGGQLVTREGIPMNQAAHSLRALRELERLFGKPMFFDGEYVHPCGLDACGRPGGTVWLFDAVPLDVWRANGQSAPLERRIGQLLDLGQKCFGPALGALKPFFLGSGGAGAQRAIAKAEELWALGYEGIVVKAAHAPYDRRRSTRWLKLKQWRSDVFRIIDVVVEHGRLVTIMVSVDGFQQRISTRAMPADAQVALASRIRAGDSARIEHTGRTSRGLLRDPCLEGIAHA